MTNVASASPFHWRASIQQAIFQSGQQNDV
jgi:hypothetical protein